MTVMKNYWEQKVKIYVCRSYMKYHAWKINNKNIANVHSKILTITILIWCVAKALVAMGQKEKWRKRSQITKNDCRFFQMWGIACNWGKIACLTGDDALNPN